MTKRPRLTVNVPKDAWEWFRRLELESGVSKTRLVLAGIASLKTLDDMACRNIVQWATLIDEERTTWDEFCKVCEVNAKERTAALKRTMDRVLQFEIAEHQKKRQSHSSVKPKGA